jgi:AcrR family transcriptional regulator
MNLAKAETVVKTKVPRARGKAKDSGEVLLGIAAKLFREKGYTGTSIRDIVKRAHIEPSALYYHFASKEALLEKVLDRSILSVGADVRAALQALSEETTPRERFQVAIATHIRSIVLHGDFALASRRVIGQIPLAQRRKHDAMRAEYGAYWQELFAMAAKQKEFRDDARLGLARMFLMGALNWTSEWFDPKKKSPEEISEIFCGILFDGLGPIPLDRAKTGGPQ